MKDLKITFDTLIYDFLKVKLCAYGFKMIKMIEFTGVCKCKCAIYTKFHAILQNHITTW